MEEEGKTCVLVGMSDQLVGCIGIADTLKPEASLPQCSLPFSVSTHLLTPPLPLAFFHFHHPSTTGRRSRQEAEKDEDWRVDGDRRQPAHSTCDRRQGGHHRGICRGPARQQSGQGEGAAGQQESCGDGRRWDQRLSCTGPSRLGHRRRRWHGRFFPSSLPSPSQRPAAPLHTRSLYFVGSFSIRTWQ